MRIQITKSHALLLIALVCFAFNNGAIAQQSAAINSPDIPALLKRLKNDKDDVAVKAAEELQKIGQPAVGPLSAFLKKDNGCGPRILGAQVMLRLDPGNASIVTSMKEVLNDSCSWSPEKDIMLRQQAAAILIKVPAGVVELSKLLQGKSIFGRFERRTVAFAFDELTEKIEGVRPDSIVPTAEMIAAIKASIPFLIMALDDKDETVHCMAFESLDQLQRSRHAKLRDEAKRLMQGVKVRCTR